MQLSFQKAVQSMGFNPDHLRLEGVDSGSSNVVANFNYLGVTWAAAIRWPVNISGAEYARQKLRTADVTQYLADRFSAGIPLAGSDRFVFDGRSFLVSAESTHDFLVKQSQHPMLRVRDELRHTNPPQHPPVQIESQMLGYEGPYFVSKGAPAQETLEHSIEFAEPILRALAALHVHTGARRTMDRTSMPDLEEIEHRFADAASAWQPQPGSKAEKRIAQYSTMDGHDVTSARREVFLQQDEGRTLLGQLVTRQLPDLASDPQTVSFIHGDAHGRNFIVVQFGYTPNHSEAFLDRVYLNELFKDFPDLEKITTERDISGDQVIYRQYRRGDDESASCVVATRDNRMDIHLIDPDTGRGIHQSEKACHLSDLVTLLISVRDWAGIHGQSARDSSDLLQTYSSEFRRQLSAIDK